MAGGIAAYKACELLRRLRDAGPRRHRGADRVGAQLRRRGHLGRPVRHPVSTSVWTGVEHVPHVQLGQQADLVLVAPATADLLARAATGRADDLLTNVLLTARCPVVFAPAMHTEMWQHPATQANVATLRSRGAVVLDPASGRLTGADSGPGRLPEPAELLAVAATVLHDPDRAAPLAAQDLAGLTVAVSAGGTREHLDPVRFLGNSSSGLMGWALARSAAQRGADVRLVAANTEPGRPARRHRASRSPPPPSSPQAMTGRGPGGRPGRDGGRARGLHPGAGQRDQDQEVRGRRAGAEPGPDPGRAGRPGGRDATDPAQLHRRVRRRDAGGGPGPGGARSGQAGSEGLRPAGAQRRQPRGRLRPAATTRSCC